MSSASNEPSTHLSLRLLPYNGKTDFGESAPSARSTKDSFCSGRWKSPSQRSYFFRVVLKFVKFVIVVKYILHKISHLNYF